MYTRCRLYDQLTAVYHIMHILTSNWVLLLILAASSFTNVFTWASWVIFLVAASAASRWTNWCLHCCCVPISDVFNVAPANRLDFDPLAAGWGGCVSIICWCGIGEKDDKEEKWEVLRTI